MSELWNLLSLLSNFAWIYFFFRYRDVKKERDQLLRANITLFKHLNERA